MTYIVLTDVSTGKVFKEQTKDSLVDVMGFYKTKTKGRLIGNTLYCVMHERNIKIEFTTLTTA
jgi:RNase P/RNase MRP subunit p30